MSEHSSTDMPEVMAIEADEAYFDELEKSDDTRWTDGGVRVSVEMHSRHVAYGKVWEAGRQPLLDLLEAARDRLDRCAEHHGLAIAASRDIRLLVLTITEVLPDPDVSYAEARRTGEKIEKESTE